MAEIPAWYDTTRRRVFLDMHLPDWTRPGQSGGKISDGKGVASAFDPERIVAEFVRARINSAVIYAKCQYGNFYCDVESGHKHAGLGDLDFLGEMIRLGHQNNIRIIGYYSNRWDVEAAREHPEWMQLDADGNRSYDRWPTLCLNSPYRDLVHTQLHELLSKYELDGVWSDMIHGQPCFSPYCQHTYAEHNGGRALPRSPQDADYVNFLRWQREYIYDYIASCRAVVKAARPEAAFLINFFGTTYTHPREGLATPHLALSDMGSTEGYTEWHGLLFPGYAARYMRMGTLDRPSEVLIGRFVNTWDFTLRPPAQVRFEAFSAAASGAAVCLDDEPYHDGSLEPRVYDQLADAYSEVEKREPYLIGAEPVYYAALYHSEKARALNPVLNQTPASAVSLVPPSNQNPGASDHIPTMIGAYKALVDAHVPVEFVNDLPESTATLSRYKVVYLPNILTLSDSEAEALRAFVRAGGGLVATGATSLYNEDGTVRENFLLADLFGVDAKGRGAYTFPYFHFKSAPFTDDVLGMPLPHYMAMWQVKPNHADVQVAATRRDPLIETGGEVYYHNNQPPPGADTGEPVITFRKYGAGRVVYCAALPESNYARLNLPAYSQLIANMVTWAAGAVPLVSADDLPFTEITTTALNGEYYLHLVTGIPQRTVRFGGGGARSSDIVQARAKLHDVRLRVQGHVATAVRVPQHEPLNVVHEAEFSIIELPKGEDWETIRVTVG
jgi:hypothetical protein